MSSLSSGYTPTPTDLTTGFVDGVAFELQVLRNVSLNLDNPTPLEAQTAKATVDLKKQMSVRLQTLLRQGQGRKLVLTLNSLMFFVRANQ